MRDPSEADIAPELGENAQSTQTTSPTTFTLLQYLNSTPLQNVVAAPTGMHEDREIERIISNRNFLIRCIIYSHLFAALLVSGLIAWTIVGYEIRLYEWQPRPSECLLFFWLVRVLLKICMNVWSIHYHSRTMSDPPTLGHLVKAYDVASCIWLIFALYYTVLNPRESMSAFSTKMCFFLIWITIACYISPMLTYTLLCLILYPVIFYIIRLRNHGSLSPGLGKKVLKMIDVDRFDAVVARLRKGEAKLSKSNGTETKDRSAVNGSISVVTVRDGDGEAPESANVTPRESQPNTTSDIDRLCAICIMEIEDSDKVYIMPCDIRHFFHRDCLKKWFKRSRICPICRLNIADLLKEAKATAAA
ncbi:uncharacterized protein BXIN_1770 [Babesia sp. Xinjiang]|uniref:uncharacterized protein n=1 Tax=Babesia sp. Xinjiang TaxID=462227 RepID=UPI000A221C9A|nr:uncharacterized protein BXIN_1649 [Babesia sp. Xinjiang]XP_028871469.1 uncharacterized protein BXIN_1770 [Babesia sp. Xinjiang]ORM40904.1 hypothetical protein BXIN_1649 [Babesia sp. Xinjiang]ORM41013.1 hypothetical protein BXIN_1770 [Babesia sp. Xinjiang]